MKSGVFRAYTIAPFDPYFTGGQFHAHRERDGFPFPALFLSRRCDVYERIYRFFLSTRALHELIS